MWIIRHLPSNTTLARIDKSQVPYGGNLWDVRVFDRERCSMFDYPTSFHLTNSRWDRQMLSLSTCNNDEFPCKDGSCININQRCSQSMDCMDFYDEKNCKKFIIPSGYLSALPAPVQPFVVKLSANLYKVT